MELCDGCHDKRVAAASESERGCAQTPVSVSHLVAAQSLGLMKAVSGERNERVGEADS